MFLARTRSPDGEGRRGVHGAQRALGGRRVVGLGGFGDRRFLDLFAAQVAGAGVDRGRRQDGAVGEHQLGGVEPAAEVAVVQVGGSVQALDRVPERVHVPPGHSTGQQRQRERPALPGFLEDRLVAARRMSGAPALGAPHVGDPVHDVTCADDFRQSGDYPAIPGSPSHG